MLCYYHVVNGGAAALMARCIIHGGCWRSEGRCLLGGKNGRIELIRRLEKRMLLGRWVHRVRVRAERMVFRSKKA